MKEETPTFYLHDQTTKRATVDLPPFLNYLEGLATPDFASKHQSNIQDHLHHLSKSYNNEEQVLQVVRFLCHTFNTTQTTIPLQFLRTVIGADLKYEANSQPGSTGVEENVKMVDNNQIIALPYSPAVNDATPYNGVVYGPVLPPTIALHAAEPMSDVCDQRKHNDSKNYYAQDNETVVDYLKEKFRVVKREGISGIFGKAAEIICIQLIEGRLAQFQKLAPAVLVELFKLLEYITPPLYTFYLLHLTQQIVEKICSILDQKENEKRFSKSDAEGIMYTLKNIADRWADSQQNSVQNMQWILQTRMISLFIHSPVSQKKLYAVKLLCEICRKSQYSASMISRESIQTFISEKGLLNEIYRADNHPEVISKGEEVFLFLVKEDRLNEDYINAIFNLLEKCHEHLSKSLFATLQRVGHRNIENQRKHLLKRIQELPRATCFNEETFNLIQTIMVSTPSSEAQASLQALYRIMEKNYDKLKEVLKGRAVTVYYEVFIMGIEQGVFDHSNAMITLKPILYNPNSSLFSFMIENFIFRLKEQYSKQIGLKCKKTLHSAIRMLIAEQQIHKLPVDDQKKHLKILNLLLENYEQLDQNLLSSEDLWVLIKMDRQFSKYLKFYPQDVQISLISHLISSESKSPYDIECIIDLYQLMSSEVKAVLAPLLCEDYFKSNHLFSKYLLARHILDIQPIAIDEAVKRLEESRNDMYLALSWIILIRQIIIKQDEKGFGKYPPYEDLRNSFELTVKVINNLDVFEPIQSEMKVKNYLNIYQITRLALRGQDVSFQKLKLKLNDQLLTLNQLKQKVCNLTTYRNVTLDINETTECEWFNKDILFDKDGAFKNEIIEILKEIFNKYASRDGKLRQSMVAKIFQKATETEEISENDHRVIYIFNNYSHNGDFITIDEWINFYYQSSLKNAPLVIDNLKKLGYNNMLKTEVNFEALFKQDNTLRDYLSSDGKIYQVLFKSYQSLIESSPIHLHDEIVKEFTATLKLLPVSTHIIACLQEMSKYLFDYSTNNTLYYWYLSNLLESVYFANLEVNDHANWKQTFERTSICQQFLTIYEKYLYKVLSNGPNRYQVNIDLQIFIIESLGKVLRQKFTEIPSLVDLKSELVPCMIRSSFVHIDNYSMMSLIAQLGLLCTNICKGKRDQQIAQNAVAIVLDMALGNTTSIKIQVIQSLIFSEILTVRQIFNAFYYLLSSNHPEVKKDYYSIHISRNSKSTYKNCKEYFNVLNKLLLTEEDDRYFQEISTVYQKELSQEKYIENLSESTETDQILLGKLKILNEIKLYNPQTQINVSTISSIKELLQHSLSQQVREILYTMTNNICDIEYSLKLMIKIMEQTNLKRNSVHRGKKKMGIMNLGCICYINAVLQQLEMIEPFRKGIIGTQVVVDTIDFFREFQHIIYQLTFGQRIFLIPESFCLNYLDSNNMPINIREQHDADEFLNQLLDRLEFRLKGTNQDHLINNNFKGELVNVINCQKCYHKKEKIENFYILSVEIKNQNNLKDCLTKLIQPEIICDYFCDFCEGKVQTIQKYNRFHSLPPFLFIHLQRLVFDLQTFTKIKLDHPVSFPTEINLQDFFQQQTEPQLYVLKGFVVHVGNSEGGHYYSIIKCENGWIKFDDTRIDDWDWDKESHDKDHAYLLIYERKRQGSQLMSQEISIGNPHIMKIVQDDINFLMKEKIFLQPSFTKYLLNTLKKMHIPEEFISPPNEHNNPYQYNFSELPRELQETLDLAYEAMMHYIKLQSQMREMRISFNDMGENEGVVNKQGNQLPSIVYYLICTLHIRPNLAFNAAQYFINEGSGNFLQSIYLHRDNLIRQAFKMIAIKVAVVITAVDKKTSFLVPIPQNEVINKLLQKVMVGLTEVGKNPLKMCQYFAMLLDLCKIDDRFVEWFQANKLGPRLIHFLMQKQSGMENLLPVYPYYMYSNHRVDSISLLIEVLSMLVHHEPDLSIEREETLLERKAYLNIELYRKFLNDRYNNQNITNIFKYAARNQKFGNKIITLVVQNLNRFNHDDDYIYLYVHIMYGLLTINDGLSRGRIERLFGVPILTSIGENDADKYLANSPTDRVCKYWNPCFKPGDEIIFSFLELLYTNRTHHSYFTLLGVICLLKLMTTNQQVNRYVKQLPGPCRDSKSYVDWMQEFVFNFEKSASSDNNSRMSQDQKHRFLQDIVQYLRDLEISQEKSSDQQAKPYHTYISRAKQLYRIGQVKRYSQWNQTHFEFFENLAIFNNQNIEQIANIAPKDIISIKYRLLHCGDAEQLQDCAKVIEYQIDIKQKARIYFTEGYHHTLYFDTGYYQLALPFTENQVTALRVELLEEVSYKPKTEEKPSEGMSQEPIIIQEMQAERREVDDFPSISDVYDQKYQSTHAENEMRGQSNDAGGGVQIECPFCSYKATSFSSKCPNCMEEWGEMGW